MAAEGNCEENRGVYVHNPLSLSSAQNYRLVSIMSTRNLRNLVANFPGVTPACHAAGQAWNANRKSQPGGFVVLEA